MYKNLSKILLGLGAITLVVLACGTIPSIPSLTGSGSNGSLFTDDFSDTNGPWGTGTNSDRSVEYGNGGLQMQVFTENFFIWSGFNDTNYQDVHVEVTVRNNSSDSTTAFGIMCDQQVTSDAFYYAAITADGEYAIAKASVAQQDVFLTNNDRWDTSELITPHAASYRLGADCGNGALTLYVDGQKIVSVTDADYTKGKVALFTWSGKETNGTDVTFDDFALTSLK